MELWECPNCNGQNQCTVEQAEKSEQTCKYCLARCEVEHVSYLTATLIDSDPESEK